MGTRDRKDYSITGGYLYGNQRQKGLLYNRRISVREPETERITVESLEFVVAQFSWNSWVPLIHRRISVREPLCYVTSHFEKKFQVSL